MAKFDIWESKTAPGDTGRTTSEEIFDGLLTGTVVDQPSHTRLCSHQWRGSGNASGGRFGGAVRQVLSRHLILSTRLTRTVERLLEIRRLHTWCTVTRTRVWRSGSASVSTMGGYFQTCWWAPGERFSATG